MRIAQRERPEEIRIGGDAIKAIVQQLDIARHAKAREGTEPFLWSGTGDELMEVGYRMVQKGIRLQRGGRFYHLTGAVTKADAIRLVVERFGEVKGTVLMRKFSCCYATGLHGARKFRTHVAHVCTAKEFYEVVENWFPTAERPQRANPAAI